MNKTCIIIPCYNEFERLPRQEFIDFLNHHQEFDLCFVNDGSTDQTQEMLHGLQELYPANIEVIELEKNQGKAEAVRLGMLSVESQKKYEWIGFFDADLATPLQAIYDFENFKSMRPKALILLGSRVKMLGFEIDRNLKRHYFGRVFATLASMILELPVYDTQCGAKLIHHSIIQDVFKEKFISPWIFDVELIARIKRLIKDKAELESYICEMPLQKWVEKGSSKIRLSSLLKIPTELAQIYFKYK